LREVQDAAKEFPDSAEITAFVSTVAPLLALAIGLRSQPIPDDAFRTKAAMVEAELKRRWRRLLNISRFVTSRTSSQNTKTGCTTGPAIVCTARTQVDGHEPLGVATM
jgi:hypothetical protein